MTFNMARIILGFLALCLLCNFASAEECGPNEIWGRCAKRCERSCSNPGDIPCRAAIATCAYQCGCALDYRRSGDACVKNCPA